MGGIWIENNNIIEKLISSIFLSNGAKNGGVIYLAINNTIRSFVNNICNNN